MKKLSIAVLVLLVLVVIAALALPLSNLAASRELDPEGTAAVTDPELRQALQLYRAKCMDCHSSQVARPVYMTWPVARDLIERDIAAAHERLDMDRALLAAPEDVSEATMAKLQQAFEDGEMPPPTRSTWSSSRAATTPTRCIAASRSRRSATWSTTATRSPATG